MRNYREVEANIPCTTVSYGDHLLITIFFAASKRKASRPMIANRIFFVQESSSGPVESYFENCISILPEREGGGNKTQSGRLLKEERGYEVDSLSEGGM